jgi:hypothetical protein
MLPLLNTLGAHLVFWNKVDTILSKTMDFNENKDFHEKLHVLRHYWPIL